MGDIGALGLRTAGGLLGEDGGCGPGVGERVWSGVGEGVGTWIVNYHVQSMFAGL